MIKRLGRPDTGDHEVAAGIQLHLPGCPTQSGRDRHEQDRSGFEQSLTDPAFSPLPSRRRRVVWEGLVADFEPEGLRGARALCRPLELELHLGRTPVTCSPRDHAASSRTERDKRAAAAGIWGGVGIAGVGKTGALGNAGGARMGARSRHELVSPRVPNRIPN